MSIRENRAVRAVNSSRGLRALEEVARSRMRTAV